VSSTKILILPKWIMVCDEGSTSKAGGELNHERVKGWASSVKAMMSGGNIVLQVVLPCPEPP
jgi:hypothetical protein